MHQIKQTLISALTENIQCGQVLIRADHSLDYTQLHFKISKHIRKKSLTQITNVQRWKI